MFFCTVRLIVRPRPLTNLRQVLTNGVVRHHTHRHVGRESGLPPPWPVVSTNRMLYATRVSIPPFSHDGFHLRLDEVDGKAGVDENISMMAGSQTRSPASTD
jgi:hypothetical protein